MGGNGMANERLCLMCGKRYRYCSNCRDFNQKETWRYLYHDEKCKEISNIWYDYRENQITGEVAKERFNALKPNIDDVLKHTTIAAREIQELFGVNKQKSEESEESETVEESAKLLPAMILIISLESIKTPTAQGKPKNISNPKIFRKSWLMFPYLSSAK